MLNKLFQEDQILVVIIQLDQHIELRADNNPHFIHIAMESSVGHDDSFSSCPSLTKSAARFGLIIYQVFDLPEDIGLVGITIDSLGHSLRVILDRNLVDFRFQVERDLANIGRLLCAGYPRRGIILCIFSVAIKEGIK